MSSEYEAAQEICSVLHEIDKNLDRFYNESPSQRERIATAAMQGYLSMYDGIECPSPEHAASIAIAYADSLIFALGKDGGK